MAGAVLADAALYQGNLDQVHPRCRDSLASDDPYPRALAHTSAGIADAYRGRIASAREHAGHARELWHRTGSPSISAWTDYLIGEILAEHEPLTALRHLDAAAATAPPGRQPARRGRRPGGRHRMSRPPRRTRHRPGRHRRRDRPLAAPRRLDAPVATLRTTAILLSRLGRHEAAVTIATAVAASAPPAYGRKAADLATVVAAATSTLGPAATAAAESEGAALAAGGVVSYALTAVADAPRPRRS